MVTCFFDITTGILQGDTLASFLFIIHIDYILKKHWIYLYLYNYSNLYLGFTLIKKIKRYPDLHITDIDYADDIAILTNSMLDANTLLYKIEDTAKDIGLHINSDKNEYMCLNHEKQIIMKRLSGHYIKSVDEFKYLGSCIV